MNKAKNTAIFKKFREVFEDDPLNTFYDISKLLNVTKDKNITVQTEIFVSGLDKDHFDVGKSGYPIEIVIKLDDFEEFNELLVDDIEICDYGYHIPEHDENLIRVGNDCTIEYESIRIESFKKEATLFLKVYGDISDLYLIADNGPFQLELLVTGYSYNAEYWKQSLYVAKQMFRLQNKTGTFMHLFLAFEGMIKSKLANLIKTLGPEASLHHILSEHVKTKVSTNPYFKVPHYIHVYRKIRNDIMHGKVVYLEDLNNDDFALLLWTIYEFNSDETYPTLKDKHKSALVKNYRF